jgi:hypothetical protein
VVTEGATVLEASSILAASTSFWVWGFGYGVWDRPSAAVPRSLRSQIIGYFAQKRNGVHLTDHSGNRPCTLF